MALSWFSVSGIFLEVKVNKPCAFDSPSKKHSRLYFCTNNQACSDWAGIKDIHRGSFDFYALFSNGYVSFEDHRKVSFKTMLKSLCCLCLRHLEEQLAFQSEFTFQEIFAPHL